MEVGVAVGAVVVGFGGGVGLGVGVGDVLGFGVVVGDDDGEMLVLGAGLVDATAKITGESPEPPPANAAVGSSPTGSMNAPTRTVGSLRTWVLLKSLMCTDVRLNSIRHKPHSEESKSSLSCNKNYRVSRMFSWP